MRRQFWSLLLSFLFIFSVDTFADIMPLPGSNVSPEDYLKEYVDNMADVEDITVRATPCLWSNRKSFDLFPTTFKKDEEPMVAIAFIYFKGKWYNADDSVAMYNDQLPFIVQRDKDNMLLQIFPRSFWYLGMEWGSPQTLPSIPFEIGDSIFTVMLNYYPLDQEKAPSEAEKC